MRNRVDTLAIVLGIVGALMTTAGFLLAFLHAPVVAGAEVSGGAYIGDQFITHKLLFSQKIFYFHVPVAMTSFLFIIYAAYCGIRYLRKREPGWDTRGRTAMTIGLVFVIAVMVTGDLWTRHDWGTWWVWEPRLTTYFILMLLVIAYFIMRTAVEDPERKATYASVFAIIAAIDVPICYMITRLVPTSMHPVVLRSDSGLPPDMLVPFLISLFGMLMVGFAFYRLTLKLNLAQERLAALKDAIEDD